jgi:uncharacterized glyoxalase superfamily protein PhnB
LLGAQLERSLRSDPTLKAHATAAFDTRELGERYHMADGTLVHADLLIGDSPVMMKDSQASGGWPRIRIGTPTHPRA